jgi:acetyltransferase
MKQKNSRAVALYIESLADVPNFLRIAQEVRRSKPVVLLKGGSTAVGAKASSSHTAALATNHSLLLAAAEQLGFVVVDTIEQFFAVAQFLSRFRQIPEHCMIIANAGGLAVSTVDALSTYGVTQATWSTAAQTALHELLPNISVANPLDLLGDAQAAAFGIAVRQAVSELGVDVVLCIITVQAVTDVRGILAELAAIQTQKPIFLSLVGGEGLQTLRAAATKQGLLCSDYPNEVAELLGALAKVKKATYLPTMYESATQTSPSTIKSNTTLPSIHTAFSALQILLCF